MWRWNEQSRADFEYLLTQCHIDSLIATMQALERIVGHGAMLAYLTAMATRLVEMHRVLKPTGSLWLHCDTTASHYLKLVLDAIFGPENFRNEVIWKRTSSHNDAKRRMGDLTDILLFYTKSNNYTFNIQYTAHNEGYIADFYRFTDENGRRYRLDNMASPNPRPNLMYEYKGYGYPVKGWRYSLETMERLDSEGRLHFPKSPTGRIQLKRFLDEMPGSPIGNVWDDILPVQAQSRERLGYPTQKPVALLERVIAMSTNEGDIVLDTFCGCGTALVAAHALRRRWIGIDLTSVATSIMKTRLENEFADLAKEGVEVDGFPTDVEGAFALADKDKHKFQNWACTVIGAYPLTKKGADGGVDGFLNFVDHDEKVHRAVVQVKGGKNVSVKDVREFQAVITREKATLGFFVCLADVKHTMAKEAMEAGMWKSAGRVEYPRVQVLTIADLMRGKARPRLPLQEKRSILDYTAGRRGRHNTQQELEMAL